MAGLTFVLSGGAAILVRYGGHPLRPWQTVLVLSLVSALWLVVAVYLLGDIYILAWGTMGGPYDGASMNPARKLRTRPRHREAVHLVGPVVGAVIAVGLAYVLRGRPSPGGQRRRGDAPGPQRLRPSARA